MQHNYEIILLSYVSHHFYYLNNIKKPLFWCKNSENYVSYQNI